METIYLQSVQNLKVPVSAAAVQGHFMQHKEHHLEAIDNVSYLNHTDGFKKTADWMKSHFNFLHLYEKLHLKLFYNTYTYLRVL